MPITTELTRALNLRVPVVQGGMQWVGVPPLVAAVSNAGGLGMLTALTQPSPDALREAIKDVRNRLKPEVKDRCRFGAFGVNITLLPSINPPDYEGYVRAALEEGVRIFETAGHNPKPVVDLCKQHGAYVIHKCTQVRHALSSQKMGVDCLSIDGFECAGHPGEMDVGSIILAARAKEDLKTPFIVSGGIANAAGLVASLALGAAGVNMGTRFMATEESTIHPKIKQCIVDSTEHDTIHIFRTLKNTARVYKNKVAVEVVEKEKAGAQFKEIAHLVSGARGRRVYEEGDPDAGIWSAGVTVGLIHDVPTCQELLDRFERESIELIGGLSKLTSSPTGQQQTRESRL